MYFAEKRIKNTTGMYNLREASLELGQEVDYLSKQRNAGKWPHVVKLARKRSGLYMQADMLPVLRGFYGLENKNE